MMVNAVDNGEAQAFAPEGYRIAGKTGTAQIPVAGNYDPDKTVASFIGFAPADNPKDPSPMFEAGESDSDNSFFHARRAG